MSNIRKEKGITIVELMVGIIIASVLVLTIGSMLFYSYLNWFRNQDAVELHRDATIAMDMIARAIRPHKGTAIGANGGSTLTAGSELFYLLQESGPPPLNLWSLWHDPNTAIAGDEIKIIENKIPTAASLAFTKFGALRFVQVSMTLTDDNAQSITVQSTINYRML